MWHDATNWSFQHLSMLCNQTDQSGGCAADKMSLPSGERRGILGKLRVNPAILGFSVALG